MGVRADTAGSLPPFAHEVSGASSLPWLTFVPGIGNDRDFWADQAAALTGRYRILRFDPWGHGDSPPPPADCGFDTIVAGLLQLWDRLGIDRSAAVGLGFGGSLALAAALAASERVIRVVACCCRPCQPDDRRAFWRERRAKVAEIGIDRMTDITVDRWLSEDFRRENPEADRRLRAMFRRTSLEGYRAYTAAFAEMDFTGQLANLAVPTLLVAGENDHGGGPVAAMQAMAQAIPAARLEIVFGAGHIVNFEAPERMRRLLEEFL